MVFVGQGFIAIDAVVEGDDQGIRVAMLECQDFMAMDEVVEGNVLMAAVLEGQGIMAVVLEGQDFMVGLPCILASVS